MVSSPSSPDRRGPGRVGLLAGLLVVAGLIGAYLSDCIPGLGAGGSLGIPASDSPAEPAEPAEPETKSKDAKGGVRLAITVDGDQCRRGDEALAPCPGVCAGLDSAQASSIVEIDATRGSHGAVETLRQCLGNAGFSDIRVRSE